MSSSAFVCVPIPVSLYNELVLRAGNPQCDITPIIEHAVESYLDRTRDDQWSDAYEAWKESCEASVEDRKRFGDPEKGLHWTPLFLPNGTKLSMQYGGKRHDAEIRHEKIFFGTEEISSPSVLASTIAAGTSRNAWRDLLIKRPADLEFRLADELRREGPRT